MPSGSTLNHIRSRQVSSVSTLLVQFQVLAWTTLAMPCAAAPRFPRCGRHFPVTFRASGLSGIAFFGMGAAGRDPKKPPSNASTAKPQVAGCRHPLSASCYANRAKGTKSLHNRPRFVVPLMSPMENSQSQPPSFNSEDRASVAVPIERPNQRCL